MNRTPFIVHHALSRSTRRTTVELERGLDIPDAPTASSSSLRYQEPHDDLQTNLRPNVPNRSISPPLSDPEMNGSQSTHDIGGVTLTGYRLSTMVILIGFGTVKAVESLHNDNIAVTWIEWVGGGLVAAIWYFVGFYETLEPPVAPWLFHEDYTLDCFYLPLGALIIALFNTYFWFSVGVCLGHRDLFANIFLDQDGGSLHAYTILIIRFFLWTSIVSSMALVKMLFCALALLYGLGAIYCVWLGIAKVLRKRHRPDLKDMFGSTLLRI